MFGELMIHLLRAHFCYVFIVVYNLHTESDSQFGMHKLNQVNKVSDFLKTQNIE